MSSNPTTKFSKYVSTNKGKINFPQPGESNPNNYYGMNPIDLSSFI